MEKSGELGTFDEVDVGRPDLPYLPWLMVTTGYTATSNGGRCILSGMEKIRPSIRKKGKTVIRSRIRSRSEVAFLIFS